MCIATLRSTVLKDWFDLMINEKPLRILIADDHYLVRLGLVALIHTKDDMQVVAEASDGKQAVALYEKHGPDLVLMDTRMPIKDGIEAMVEIRK